ncbi:amino acid ABC transporter permease [Ferrovibrio sp.]|uniref:amino acid ABC transporter permease n=1 Tax=Ferrovibrio sp. TaxID=1917215 RepID=UPI0035AE13E1
MGYTFHFEDVFAYGDLLLRGTWLTMQLTAISTVLGLIVGIAGALGRNSTIAPVRWISGAYVEMIRNTPFIVQLFFLYFGLAQIGVKMTAEQAALLAMVVNLGAYATEIVRAGIDATSKGQWEAGMSLAMTRMQVFRHVVLLPALEKIYPALTSQFIIVMLGSSVVSQISAEELTFAGNFIQSRNFRSFEVYFVITGIYLVLSLGFRQIFRLIGQRAFRKA